MLVERCGRPSVTDVSGSSASNQAEISDFGPSEALALLAILLPSRPSA